MDHAKWKSMKKCARKWCRKLSIGPLERCGPLWWLSIWLSTFYLIFQATCCPGGQNCCPFGFVCTVNDDGSYGCGISPQSTTEKPWSSKSTWRNIVETSSQYKVVTLASIDIKKWILNDFVPNSRRECWHCLQWIGAGPLEKHLYVW